VHFDRKCFDGYDLVAIMFLDTTGYCRIEGVLRNVGRVSAPYDVERQVLVL
jgi:hypothetical protein